MSARTLSPVHEICAGVLAGVADALACHPVDMVKTRFHVNVSANGSLLAALAAQARTGGVASLYRGVLAAALRPQALCMYTGNEWCKRLVVGPGGELSAATATAAGFLTGYVESACVTPFELVKVRMQVKEHAARYASSAACATAIVREEGPLALWRGFGATCGRNCVFNGAYFGLIFAAQTRLPRRATAGGDAAQNLAVGAVAGCVATLFKAPWDVVKSRIQAQAPGPVSTERLYRNAGQTMLLVARTEGPLALWKGMAPMLMRMVLGMSVSFAVFDAALVAMSGGGEGTRAAAAAAASEETQRMPSE